VGQSNNIPDLESLRCFDAVATHLTFRVAAKTLALTPTKLTRRIQQLEELLGAPLFERTSRKVALTPAGQRLVPHARSVLEQAARSSDVVHAQSLATRYELRIGTHFELGLSWLTPALPDLNATHPERTLHLVFADGQDLLDCVRSGSLDAAITSARPLIGGIAHETLHHEQYVFVGAARLLRARRLSRSADAMHHVLVDAAPDLPLFRHFLDAIGGPNVWSFARHEYLGTIAAVRLRVLQGAGVAVLPRHLVSRDLAARRLACILPRVMLSRDALRFVWRADHPGKHELRGLARALARTPLR
jgi:DNA-binding transcriptional LysR family regulator